MRGKIEQLMMMMMVITTLLIKVAQRREYILLLKMELNWPESLLRREGACGDDEQDVENIWTDDGDWKKIAISKCTFFVLVVVIHLT